MDPGGNDADLQLMAALQGIPVEQAALLQRQRRAQSLMETPTATGQQIGQVYRAASPLEHLAVALSRYKGGRALQGVETDQGALMQRAQQAGLAQAKMARADKDRAFGLQQSEAERQAARDAAAAADRQAAAARAEAEAKATADYRAQQLGIERAKVSQDAWRAVPDPSGGVVLYNPKTGATRPLGPQGAGLAAGGAPRYPGKPVQMEGDVQSLGKDLEPIQKAVPDLAALQAAAARGDVAGFGPIQGHIPNIATSAEGVANRQAAGRLMASIIQATSGQAASEKEVDRLLEANGMPRSATDEQIKIGISKLATQYENLLKQREAKYHPQVVETYKQRGGMTSLPGEAPPGAPAPAPQRMQGNDGKWYVLKPGGWEAE